jgi:hypothetical protein
MNLRLAHWFFSAKVGRALRARRDRRRVRDGVEQGNGGKGFVKFCFPKVPEAVAERRALPRGDLDVSAVGRGLKTKQALSTRACSEKLESFALVAGFAAWTTAIVFHVRARSILVQFLDRVLELFTLRGEIFFVGF